MRTLQWISFTLLTAAAVGACQATSSDAPGPDGAPRPGKAPKADCAPAEGETATGRALADSIMAQWQRKHPERNWEEDVRRAHPHIPEPADNSGVVGGAQAGGETYGRYTEKDVLTWKRELELEVLEGARVFHDGDALGSTVAVSCDMCHPDAANTHPETYPKYQVQTGRVILLRDMINWCLVNPVRAEAMQPDDPRMRAMEAYIVAQRKGMPLNYGKH